MTQYHVFDLSILPSRMAIKIDDKETFSTTDHRFIPSSTGHFAIGKALTGRRDEAGRTEDDVFVDWVEIYQ